MSQSVKRSWSEAWINILIGYTVNFIANITVFPLFGYNVTLHDNIYIGIIYTFISLGRQFTIRRIFAKND